MVLFMMVTIFLMTADVLTSFEDKIPENWIESKPVEQRAATIPNKDIRWPHGMVFYALDQTFSNRHMREIRSAIEEIQWHTCVRWIEIDERHIFSVDHYVYIKKGDDCWSEIGRREDLEVQYLDLEPCNCFDRGSILHMLLHTLGFQHEHQRPDRDQYVKVRKNNIKKNEKIKFQRLTHFEAELLDIAYDYSSVMHYPAYKYAKNTSIPTIKPKQNNVPLEELGHGAKYGYLTESDIQKINKFYNCSSRQTARNSRKKEIDVLWPDFVVYDERDSSHDTGRDEAEFKWPPFVEYDKKSSFDASSIKNEPFNWEDFREHKK